MNVFGFYRDIRQALFVGNELRNTTALNWVPAAGLVGLVMTVFGFLSIWVWPYQTIQLRRDGVLVEATVTSVSRRSRVTLQYPTERRGLFFTVIRLDKDQVQGVKKGDTMEVIYFKKNPNLARLPRDVKASIIPGIIGILMSILTGTVLLFWSVSNVKNWWNKEK